MLKKYIVLSVTAIILTMFAGQFLKQGIIDAQVLKINTIDDINNMTFQFDVIFDEFHCDGFKKYKNSYIEELKDVAVVGIVEPTGNVEQRYYLLRQEVTVKKIIKGDPNLEGKTIFLQESDGVTYLKGTKVITNSEDAPPTINITHESGNLNFVGIRNIMQKENQYLVFLNYRKSNEKLEKNPLYDIYGYFGYLKLNVDDYDGLAELGRTYKLSDLKNYEFFSSSANTLKELYDIKKIVLEKYYQ